MNYQKSFKKKIFLMDEEGVKEEKKKSGYGEGERA